MNDDLTPSQIEAKLRWLFNQITLAQSALRSARDAEVEAKHTYEAKHRASILSAECPKVTRGGVTKDERDAWVDALTATERLAYDIAEVTRKSAEDHVRALRDQSMIVMALSKSVQDAYRMAGVAS